MNSRSKLPETRSHLVLILKEEEGQHFGYSIAVTECLTEAVQGRKDLFGSGSQGCHESASMADAVCVMKSRNQKRPDQGLDRAFKYSPLVIYFSQLGPTS